MFNSMTSEESLSLLISALEIKLELSFEDRIESHDLALELANDLREAGDDLHGKPKVSS